MSSMSLSKFRGSHGEPTGFVVHTIPTPGTGRISGWFNSAGTMTDAELVYPNGRTRSVKRYGPLWRHAQSVGGQWGIAKGGLEA